VEDEGIPPYSCSVELCLHDPAQIQENAAVYVWWFFTVMWHWEGNGGFRIFLFNPYNIRKFLASDVLL
jgi:hypothetical protein